MEPFELESIYKTVFQKCLEGICFGRIHYTEDLIHDIEIVEINSAFAKVSGIKTTPWNEPSVIVNECKIEILGLIKDFRSNESDRKEFQRKHFFKTTSKWCKYKVQFIQNAYFIIFLEDITEMMSIEINLVKSNNLLHATLEAAENGIVAFDKERHALVYNKKYLELSGLRIANYKDLSLDTVMKNVLPQVLNPEHILEEKISMISEPGKIFRSNVRMKDGKTLERVSKPLIIDNEVQGRIICLHDITQSLSITRLLNIIMDATADGIMAIDKNYKILKYNNRICEIMDIPLEDLDKMSGKDLIQFVLPKIRYPEEWMQITQKTTLLPGESQECIIEKMDGKVYRLIERPIFVDDEIEGKVISLSDITQEWNYQNKLESAIKKLNFHIDNNPLAVIEFDNNMCITNWSQVAEKTFGWKKEEVLGKRYDDFRFVFDDDMKQISESEAHLLEEQKDNLQLNKNYKKDGSVIHCKWHNSVQKDSDGNILSILSIVEDITQALPTHV